MPRPTLSDDVLERLEATAADRLEKVPVDHLSTTQRLELLLDELADADARADRLESRVEDLENQLEAARENPQANDHDRDRVDATEGIDGLDLNTSTRPDYRGR